jgi:hypothetical protein
MNFMLNLAYEKSNDSRDKDLQDVDVSKFLEKGLPQDQVKHLSKINKATKEF